jgi:hypothetical protein
MDLPRRKWNFCWIPHILQDKCLQEMVQKSQVILAKEVEGLLVGDGSFSSSSSGWSSLTLYEFVSSAIFRASAGPILSMGLAEQDDYEKNLSDLRALEKDIGLLFVGAPKFMAPEEGVRGRDALMELFMSDKVKSAESPFLQERRRLLYEHLGNTQEFRDDMDPMIGRMNLGFLFAAAGNSIQDREAYDACTEAVRNVVAKRKQHDQQDDRDDSTLLSIQELDELVVLQSAFQESLRMYQALFVITRLVEKGTTCMILPNVLHMDPEIFENPDVYKFDRFVRMDPTTNMATKHLRPFGGGAHHCPCRKFISYEARALLAMVLWKYNLRLKPGEMRPGVDFTKQGTISARQCAHS